MVPMDTIKDRVTKLLMLASSSNENEAAVAMAMAQDLMDRHKISVAELCVGEVEEGIVRDAEAVFAGGRIPHWKTYLVQSIAKNNGCSIIKVSHQGHARAGERGSKIEIFGRPTDIAAVRFMLAYSVTQLTRHAPKGKGHVFSNSWYLGAVQGISQKMADAKKAAYQTASKYALVKLDTRDKKVDEFVAENIPNLRKGAAVRSNIDSGAYWEGHTKGKSMDINDKSRIGARSTIGMNS